MSARPLSLFEGHGIEIEVMVVDAETLDVRSLVDEVLRAANGGGEWVEDFDDGPIGWSNELVSHVVEFKTSGPVASLSGLSERFRASMDRFRALLREHGARLMPGGMHPWMDPRREARLWPHEHGPVYRAYDGLFDCRRHGWANLQSVHLNLPFADDHEFGRLMAACRLALPLVPALAASSPVVEGRLTGMLDARLDHYRHNAERVPEMAGAVVPEAIYEPERYRAEVLGALDRRLGSIGAPEVLRGQEWTNARGVIARFDRMALEIRLIDSQECTPADLAVAAAVTGVVRGLVEERWSSCAEQQAYPSDELAKLLWHAAEHGPGAALEDRGYARLLGLEGKARASLGAAWRQLAETSFAGPPELEPPLQLILSSGTLAERVLASLGPRFGRDDLRRVYGTLCDCLDTGTPFVA